MAMTSSFDTIVRRLGGVMGDGLSSFARFGGSKLPIDQGVADLPQSDRHATPGGHNAVVDQYPPAALENAKAQAERRLTAR